MIFLRNLSYSEYWKSLILILILIMTISYDTCIYFNLHISIHCIHFNLWKKNYIIFLRIDDFTYGRSFILFFLSLEIKINKIKQHVMLCMHLVQRSFFIMQVLRNTCTRWKCSKIPELFSTDALINCCIPCKLCINVVFLFQYGWLWFMLRGRPESNCWIRVQWSCGQVRRSLHCSRTSISSIKDVSFVADVSLNRVEIKRTLSFIVLAKDKYLP